MPRYVCSVSHLVYCIPRLIKVYINIYILGIWANIFLYCYHLKTPNNVYVKNLKYLLNHNFGGLIFLYYLSRRLKLLPIKIKLWLWFLKYFYRIYNQDPLMGKTLFLIWHIIRKKLIFNWIFRFYVFLVVFVLCFKIF